MGMVPGIGPFTGTQALNPILYEAKPWRHREWGGKPSCTCSWMKVCCWGKKASSEVICSWWGVGQLFESRPCNWAQAPKEEACYHWERVGHVPWWKGSLKDTVTGIGQTMAMWQGKVEEVVVRTKVWNTKTVPYPQCKWIRPFKNEDTSTEPRNSTCLHHKPPPIISNSSLLLGKNKAMGKYPLVVQVSWAYWELRANLESWKKALK